MGCSHSLEVPNLHGIIIAPTSQIHWIATPRDIIDALSVSFECAYMHTIRGIPDHDIFIGRCEKSLRVRTCRFDFRPFQSVLCSEKLTTTDGSYMQKLGTRHPD